MSRDESFVEYNSTYRLAFTVWEMNEAVHDLIAEPIGIKNDVFDCVYVYDITGLIQGHGDCI